MGVIRLAPWPGSVGRAFIMAAPIPRPSPRRGSREGGQEHRDLPRPQLPKVSPHSWELSLPGRLTVKMEMLAPPSSRGLVWGHERVRGIER